MAPAALGLRQAVVPHREVGAMGEAMAPDRMSIAEPAHREDRPGGGQPQASAAAELGVEPRDAPRSRRPLDGKGRGVEMLLRSAVADDDGPPIPGMAFATVVAVEEGRVVGEIADRKRGVEGKRVSVRIDLGGGRTIKK